MSPYKKTLHRIIYPACTFYFIMTFIFALIAYSVRTDFSVPVIDFKGISLIFIFCLILSCANCIFYSEKIQSMVAKVALHFVMVMVDFIAVFMLIGKYFSGSSATIVILFAVSIIYVMFASVGLLIHGAVKKTEQKKYQSQFTKVR